MTASKVTKETLEAAASQIGVRVELTTLSASGKRWRVKVYPLVPDTCYTLGRNRRKGEKGDAPYQRESVGYYTAGRRVHAVCWHGFRDFFRAVYEREPDAVFRTSLDTWKGSEDFEARYRESGHKNIGPQIAPVCFAEACRCGESGIAV